MVKKHTSPYYPDIPLFLVLIPFISGFNYYLTYTNVQFNWWFVFTYTLDTLTGYVAWLGARKVILWLDHKMPYVDGFIKRVTIQFLLTTIVGLFIISFLTELSSLIVKGKWAHPSFYSHDLFIISIWFFVINAIYIMIHYYYKWQGTEEKVKSEKEKLNTGILAKEGKMEVRVPFSNILGFSVEKDYVAVFTNTGKQYFLDSTLEKISSKLPEKLFFRLNRQYVVNRNTITGFQRRENGKLSVTLTDNPSIPQEIMVSRTKAPTFKRWFRNLD
ncbi:LytTR family DNA-binding domain-containing protein [Flagellimonas meridianipacifica]|uniref:LytTr DNA-binding domain-containing protein n=1 Tax=Flagellimonas meridianipacifica TaxID=1080225 RepID=A0A2T0MC86_9FLAO|nr:LytTR family DNA-binding domain-containing protein [Allomuricauda pacifica]PRX55099.1 LytTr DNA-binding domain-containing protein [Allomuricauda pacifica]